MGALDTLGWLQFERLCELVLEAETGIEPSRWDGVADGQRQLLSTDRLRIAGEVLAPPVLVRCLWLRGSADERTVRLASLRDADRLRLWPAQTLRSVVTFVNAPAAAVAPESLDHLVLGEEALTAMIGQRPALRLRMPSLLSLDAAPPEPAPLERSTFDLGAARELADVFVATPAWHRAVAVLRSHHFLVLTGPPEMGKTAIARMLGLALLAEGWEVHECTRPDQIWDRLDPERPQLLIADDAFGSTEYRPDAAEHWATQLDRMLRATDETHWLVWTSRPAPLRAALRRLHRERGAERFPQPAAVQVDAAALGPEEKTLILFRHARAADLPPDLRALIRNHGSTIVDHPHFTPERIRRLVARRPPAHDFEGVIDAELRDPTPAMATSYAALAPEHRELLLAMLDSPPGPVAERELAHALRRHASNGLPKAPADLVDRLADHFVRVIA